VRKVADLLPHERTTRLRAARTAMGWSQGRLIMEMQRAARDLHIALPDAATLKTNVSRWENGRVRVEAEDYRRMFRAVYGMTDEELGFDRQPPGPAAPVPTIDRDVLAHFRAVLREHAVEDNLLGPHQLLGVVDLQTRALAGAMREVRGDLRRDLLDLTCRYHEFLGWLLQDAGNLDAAMRHSDRAMDYAYELDDPLVTAYVLMRKSNIATDSGVPDIALGLVDAALRSGNLPARMYAVVLRQQANAYAVLGEPAGCADAIARAYDVVDKEDPVGNELAPYCTAAYLEMEAAACWTRLDRPEQALSVFQRSLTDGATSHRRDKGLSLARLATAHASVGDIESACYVGAQALQVASSTGSARTTRELLQLRHRLAPWRKQTTVSGLTHAIGNLAGRAT
jgi:transcriptional regulator with XRE-family HTH domain